MIFSNLEKLKNRILELEIACQEKKGWFLRLSGLFRVSLSQILAVTEIIEPIELGLGNGYGCNGMLLRAS